MTNQELCTQYELLLALMETGNTDKAVAILKDAVARIKGSEKEKTAGKAKVKDK